MYYNNECKEKFINSINNISEQRDYKRLFSITSIYEHQVNVDVGSIDNINLYDFFSNNSDTFQASPLFYCRLNTRLKKYRLWYNNNVMLTRIEKFDVNQLDFTKLVKEKCLSIETLCENIKKERYKGYYSIPLIILLLKFLGVKNKDIAVLKDTDIDFVNNKLYVGDEQIDVPYEIMEIFYEYSSQDKLYLNERNDVLDKVKSPYFIKKIKTIGSLNIQANSVGTYLVYITNKKLDVQFVRFSGILYRIRELNKKGLSIENSIIKVIKIQSSEKKSVISITKKIFTVYKNIYHLI